ncbi:MAG TPA: hypothetical protein PK181_11090, partial [Methanothrix soehngenii]|nr:hypothetical protein [Methanothrix soehngenii]
MNGAELSKLANVPPCWLFNATASAPLAPDINANRINVIKAEDSQSIFIFHPPKIDYSWYN